MCVAPVFIALVRIAISQLHRNREQGETDMQVSDDRIRAIRNQHPEFIPVSLGILPSAWLKYRADLEGIAARYPLLFSNPPKGERDYDSIVGGTYAAGKHVDGWGCVWENIHHGQEAIVTGHPVPTRAAVRELRAPEVDIGLPHGFMFLRLADLRGFEEIMIDFAEEPPELRMLIDTVLEYNIRQVKLLLQRVPPPSDDEPTILYFGDDLGIQTSLPISPEKWRKYLKPCYAELYGMCKDRGFIVYMHTDGHILEVIPDLVECGVDVINPQFRANGLDELVDVCKGKVCVDLDLDRQLFPFCTPDDIDTHVRRSVEALGTPEGGLWLKAEVDDGVPIENIEAICAALMKYRGWFAADSPTRAPA